MAATTRTPTLIFVPSPVALSCRLVYGVLVPHLERMFDEVVCVDITDEKRPFESLLEATREEVKKHACALIVGQSLSGMIAAKVVEENVDREGYVGAFCLDTSPVYNAMGARRALQGVADLLSTPTGNQREQMARVIAKLRDARLWYRHDNFDNRSSALSDRAKREYFDAFLKFPPNALYWRLERSFDPPQALALSVDERVGERIFVVAALTPPAAFEGYPWRTTYLEGAWHLVSLEAPYTTIQSFYREIDRAC